MVYNTFMVVTWRIINGWLALNSNEPNRTGKVNRGVLHYNRVFVSKRYKSINKVTNCIISFRSEHFFSLSFVGTVPAMGMEASGSAIVFLLLLFIHVAHSFYLPGVAPQDFEKVNARICAP